MLFKRGSCLLEGTWFLDIWSSPWWEHLGNVSTMEILASWEQLWDSFWLAWLWDWMVFVSQQAPGLVSEEESLCFGGGLKGNGLFFLDNVFPLCSHSSCRWLCSLSPARHSVQGHHLLGKFIWSNKSLFPIGSGLGLYAKYEPFQQFHPPFPWVVDIFLNCLDWLGSWFRGQIVPFIVVDFALKFFC